MEVITSVRLSEGLGIMYDMHLIQCLAHGRHLLNDSYYFCYYIFDNKINIHLIKEMWLFLKAWAVLSGHFDLLLLSI